MKWYKKLLRVIAIILVVIALIALLVVAIAFALGALTAMAALGWAAAAVAVGALGFIADPKAAKETLTKAVDGVKAITEAVGDVVGSAVGGIAGGILKNIPMAVWLIGGGVLLYSLTSNNNTQPVRVMPGQNGDPERINYSEKEE